MTAAQTQPRIINSVVVELVKRELKKEHNHIAKVAAKGKVKAKAAEKSQFVTVTAEARTPRAARAAGEHGRRGVHQPSAHCSTNAGSRTR